MFLKKHPLKETGKIDKLTYQSRLTLPKQVVQEKSRRSVLNTGLAKIGVKELIYKVKTCPIFLIRLKIKETLMKLVTHYGFGCV